MHLLRDVSEVRLPLFRDLARILTGASERPEELDSSVRAKLHLDMLMHQNNLLWSRFQILYFIEIGFFGISYALRNHHEALAATWFACSGLLIYLFITNRADMALRNAHISALRELGFDATPRITPHRWPRWTGAWETLSNVALYVGIFVINATTIGVLYSGYLSESPSGAAASASIQPQGVMGSATASKLASVGLPGNPSPPGS